MIKLEIEAIDAFHLRKQLAEILGGAPTAPFVPEDDSKPKATRKKAEPTAEMTQGLVKENVADTSTSTESTVSEEAGSAQDADQPASDEPHALTYDGDIKPAVLKVSAHDPAKGGGREGVLALMAQFDVPHINKVPEEKWPELLDAINLVLEG